MLVVNLSNAVHKVVFLCLVLDRQQRDQPLESNRIISKHVDTIKFVGTPAEKFTSLAGHKFQWLDVMVALPILRTNEATSIEFLEGDLDDLKELN